MLLLKIFCLIVLMHAIGLSLIWIGFPAPLPREGANFVYAGAEGVSEIAGQPSTGGFSSQNSNVRYPEGGVFIPWITHRSVTRPTH